MAARRLLRLVAGLALLAAGACTSNGGPRRTAETFARAELALQNGELSQALALADDGLAASTAQADSDWIWRFRLLRSDVLLERGDLKTAVDQLREDPPEGEGYAAIRGRRTYLRAKAARNEGRLQEALDQLAEVRRLAPRDVTLQLAADWLTGQLHLRMARWQEGESLLTDVSFRAAAAGNRHQQALALLDLGMSHLVRSRYDEALIWLERVSAFRELERSTVVAKALNNAGICYARLGLFDRAIHTQQRAVEMQQARGASVALDEALGSLGVTHGLSGDLRGAVPYLQRAMQVATQAGSTSDAALWAGNLASAHARLGEWDEAEQYNEASRRLGSSGSRVKPVYTTLNAAEIAAGRGEGQRASQLYQEALASADGAASVTWTAQVGLAQVAIAARQPDVAARHFEAALDTVERTRSDLLKTDYKLSFLTQLIEFYRSYVDALVAQGRTAHALEIAESSRGRVLAERQRVDAPARTDVKAFQQVARRTGTVLLSYWLAPTRSFLWVITAGGIRRVDLPPAGEIESAVREYRAMVNNSLADPLARPATPGDRLFQMLVTPAALPHGASVVIVPDGALHGVNFETLPVDGPRRHYWIEDAEVQVAPSLAMLTVAPRSAPRDQALLLIGNPTPRAPEFPALSYAPMEMTSIVRHFPQDRVTAYDSGRATPAVYRDAPLDRFSMIHFTAHATANVESPLDSAVVLSGPDTGYKLYARDVAETPLNADLVTVSSCRSAGERTYSGEGLVGFAWAFLRAGARRVIAGLWDVDDRSTARLMDALYGGIRAGRTPARALRDAKLALINEGGQLARPYYWGPFQLFTVSP